MMMTRLQSIAGGVLAVAALLTSAPAASAQHHGGFSGGGHFAGGYHGSGYGGHNMGGYNHGFNHGYYNRGYGWGGYGYGYPGFGLYLGLGGYDGGYYGGGYGGGYGGYSGYNSSPGYAYSTPDMGAPAQQPTAPNPNVAHLVIQAAPGAQVWIENTPVQQNTPIRELDSPPLEPGQVYHYTIKAQWNANGQSVTQERSVNVKAGQVSFVDFNQPANANSSTAPSNPPIGGTAPQSPPATTPPAPGTQPPA
jgi:uncharacterized protein (TIGR03000 family)